MDTTIGMQDAEGKKMHDKTSITEIFAKFYEDLYRSRRKVSECTEGQTDTLRFVGGLMDPEHSNSIDAKLQVPKFDAEELETGLKFLKAGKAKDSMVFVAEMLKVWGCQAPSSSIATHERST